MLCSSSVFYPVKNVLQSKSDSAVVCCLLAVFSLCESVLVMQMSRGSVYLDWPRFPCMHVCVSVCAIVTAQHLGL